MTDYSKLTMEQCKKLEAVLVAKVNKLRAARALPPIAQDIHVANLYQQLWGG